MRLGQRLSLRALLLLVSLALLLPALQVPAAAQGTFNLFGSRNHPELTWSTYDTEHFRLVYSDGLAEIAKRAGSIAEQAYDLQRRTLSLSIGRRYYIYLSDRDQIPNAGTSPYGYTFIYVSPARYLTLFSSSRGWLEQVISHELVHALLFENTRGWWDVLIPLKGRSIPRDIQEGMAQFYGGEQWSVQRGDRYLNLLVRSKESRPDSLAIDAGAAEYAVGFAKIKWLRQAATDQEIGQIFAPGGHRARFSFGKAFEQATGREYRDVKEEWRKAIDVYYNWRAGNAERTEALGPTLEEAGADYLLVVKRSPQGEGLAFSGVRRRQSPDYALYYYDDTSKRLTELARKNIRDNFSFDPSGRRIAFARWHYGTHGDIVTDLFLVDVRTGKETQLTRNMRALEPVFVGPQALVFIRQEGLVSNFYRLSLVPGAPGATPEPLTSFTSEGYFSDLSASADGRYVLAAYLRPKEKRQGILTIDLTTKTVVETPQPAICRFPLFAPRNGHEILFTSEEDGVLNVYRLDIDTGTKTAVTRQVDSVMITDWREETRAIGIRQYETARTEAFALDPYRQPQHTPAEPQPYYANWLKTEPRTAMAFDDREVPGQYRGRFRSLSTFRFLGVAPALAMITNNLAAGVVAVASDMPGHHLMAADVLSDFRGGGRPNGGLSYLNRATSADINAQVGYRDVTTFSFYGPDADLYEAIWSGHVGLTREWPLTSRHGTHRLFLGAGAEDSEVLPQPGVMEDGSQPVLAVPARDYRIGSVAAVYQFTEVRPYARFPVDAKGAGVSYQYHRSLAGENFSFEELWLRGYWMQGFARDRITLLGNVMLAGQAGTSPAQLRLGMAKYSSGNTLLDYSSQVYIRGGEQYVPGNRQLTTTVELRLPVVSVLEPFAFVDGFRAWGDETSRLASAGGGFRLPPVLGSSVEAGWARLITGASRHGWQLYVTVQRVLPF